MDKLTAVCTHRWMDRQTHRKKDGWKDRQKCGKTEIQTDGKTDGHKDEWRERQTVTDRQKDVQRDGWIN